MRILRVKSRRHRIGAVAIAIVGFSQAAFAADAMPVNGIGWPATVTLALFLLTQTVVITYWAARLGRSVEQLEKLTEDHEKRLRRVEYRRGFEGSE